MSWQFVPVRSDASASPRMYLPLVLFLIFFFLFQSQCQPAIQRFGSIPGKWALSNGTPSHSPMFPASPTALCQTRLNNHQLLAWVTCVRFRSVPAVRGAPRLGNFLIDDDESAHLDLVPALFSPARFYDDYCQRIF
jgi:hypothetical protein